MVSYVLNVDRAGDLKFGRKKCRLHKKSEVVQVAKDYGIPTPNKKTVSDLCGRLKKKIREGDRVSREEKKALNKKVAANFMKGMVTTNANIKKLRELNVKNTPPKPRGPNPTAVMRARANAKDVIRKSRVHKDRENLRKINRMSPRRVMKLARELRRLR